MTSYPQDDLTLNPRHQLHELILEAIDAIVPNYDGSAGAELDPAVADAVGQRIEASDALTRRLFDYENVRGAFAALVQGYSSEQALAAFDEFRDEARLAVLRAAAGPSAVRLGLRVTEALRTATAADLNRRNAALSPSRYTQEFMVSYASTRAGQDTARLRSDVDITTDSTTIVVGSEANFVVKVSGYHDDDPVPAGEVVLVTGEAIPSIEQLVNGSAAFTLRLTKVGGATVWAEFVPEREGGYEASGGQLAIWVEPRPTTTSVKLNPGRSSYGEAVDLIAEVMDSLMGTPVPASLEVEFWASGNRLGLVPTDNDGRATYPGFKADQAGAYTISARLAGKDQFAGSEGAAALCVDKASADLTVKIDVPMISAGQTATVNATVAPPGGAAVGSATPTGTVAFDDGSGPTQVRLSGGVATWPIVPLAKGSPYTLTASYLGDGNYAATGPKDVKLVVNRQVGIVTVAGPSTVPASSPVVVSAEVQAGPSRPTGTITFRDGSGSPPQVVGLINGIGTGTLLAPAGPSTMTVTVDYSGDAESNPARGTHTALVTAQSAHDGIAKLDPEEMLAGDPRYVSTTSATLDHAAALYRTIAFGDSMGVNAAYSGLVARWQAGNLNPSTPLAAQLSNQLLEDWKQTQPDRTMATRAMLSMQVFGLAPDLADQPVSSAWPANMEFTNLWASFYQAVLEYVRAGKDSHIAAAGAKRFGPLADLILTNLNQIINDAVAMRIKDLARQVQQRLTMLSDPQTLDALDAGSWQEAVARLTQPDSFSSRLSDVSRTGQMVKAVEDILSWIGTPSGARNEQALTDAVIALDALSGPPQVDVMVAGRTGGTPALLPL
jgi:hypothetical protein